MKPSLVIIIAAALVLAGCSSSIRVNEGLVHASTFRFVNTGPHLDNTIADERQAVHQMIHDAITKNLAAKGVTQNSNLPPDIIVGYLVIIGNNVATETINDYFGYNKDTVALEEKAHDIYTSGKNPNYFEAGTLLIDITDARTYKLLKRNYATRPILRNVPEDAKAAHIQQVVDEILAELHVKQ